MVPPCRSAIAAERGRNAAERVGLVRRHLALESATLPLLVAGIVPGLVYLFASRRTKTVAIAVLASPSEGGATVDLVGSGLSSEALAFFRGLHAQPRGRRNERVAEPTEPGR